MMSRTLVLLVFSLDHSAVSSKKGRGLTTRLDLQDDEGHFLILSYSISAF